MATKPAKQRTLHDHLSRLNLKRVEKLLGADAKSLLANCRQYQIEIPQQAKLTAKRLQVRFFKVINGKRNAVVTISLSEHKRKRLKIDCTPCPQSDTLIAAVLHLVLDNKLELGLSIPPGEEPPWELLDDEALTLYAITQREKRAKDERMKIESHDPSTPWADYSILNYQSGKSYHAALRSFEPNNAYCSCQDFKTNLLGTCKHLIKLQAHIQRKFKKADLETPHVQKEFAVALTYGNELTPRLLRPANSQLPQRLLAKLRAYDALTDKAAPEMLRRLLDLVRELEAAEQPVRIYPDAERWIEEQLIRSHLKTKTASIRENPDAHPLRTRLLKAELLPYQLDGIAFAAGAGRAILADDMGLGKTIQGIGVAALLKEEANIERVLVICPASLKAQWQAEIAKFSDLGSTQVLGTAAERAAQYANSGFFTICNYEQVMRDILHIESQNWDLIILDEGQRIKNWEAKTSRVVKGLRSPFALVLSGTPMENRLDELYSVVEFIDDRRLGPAYRFFSKHRVVNTDGKVTGFRKLDELRAHIEPIILRRTRDSVLGQLPPRSTQFIRIPPTDEQAELHAHHMQTVASITRKSYLTEMDFMRLQKALLMCRMTADSTTLVDKQRPGYSSKLEKLGELIQQLCAEPGRKVVLFSEWTQMLDLIEEQLQSCKAGFVRLDGKVPQKKRQQLVKTFQTDPDCRFIIMTNAGSTGLNLQAADTVINVDLPWNPAVLEQRIARAHRMGQKRPVQVYILVTDETIEENLLATLSAKKELATAAVDMDSELNEVALECGIEELKRRLEILIGAEGDAPIDESQRAEAAAQDAARKEQLALSGGQLFSAVFAFLNDALPAPQTDPSEQQTALQRQFTEGLEQCTERDAEGRPSLRITLPDDASLQALAAGFAKFAALAQAPEVK
ncbi:DEAD/DEAH box helicase [Coraliomargarita algicola]|uniref:DEAD/DEAH box helicase n=1 Tax=Coraliomargarita algicola TaxID=3092156 RepID=A0ABZ0RGW9_9BACT|nr:DEAD/DEAH box helicase [Coraliomargarita sp. J2-16]WPJ94797.1 DEAD/DEAH box helicase [Coraliomargarita sp. J2-16]